MLVLRRGTSLLADNDVRLITRTIKARTRSHTNSRFGLNTSTEGVTKRAYASRAVKTRKAAGELPRRLGAPGAQHDVSFGGLQDEAHLTPSLETGPSDISPKQGRKNALVKDEVLDSVNERQLPKPRRKRKTVPIDATEEHDSTGPQKSSSYRPRSQLATEIQENLSRFPHCILLTRVGQFYESYYDQAQEVAHLLSIKLTSRTWEGQRVWMCGFPLSHLDKHLKTLVQQHKRPVAMCEEFQKPPIEGGGIRLSKATFERRVTRVITPGTLIDESFLSPLENSFLLAVHVPQAISNSSDTKDHIVELAWIDVSTGELFSKTANYGELEDHLVRISPQEVVLDSHLQSLPSHPLYTKLQEANCPISFLAQPTHTSSVSSTDQPLEKSNENMSATKLLSEFLKRNLLEYSPKELKFEPDEKMRGLEIDAHTLKALEIKGANQEGYRSGSLVASIKRTSTSAGTRLVTRWLCSPSSSQEEIRFRHDIVEMFHRKFTLRLAVIELLKQLEDATKIMQKFSLGKGSIGDLVSIQRCIILWSKIKEAIRMEESLENGKRETEPHDDYWESVNKLTNRLSNLDSLAIRIGSAVGLRASEKQTEAAEPAEEASFDSSSEDCSVEDSTIATQYIIKPQFSQELESLLMRYEKLQSDKDALQTEFRQQYDSPSLTLRHSSAYGMHVHSSKARRDIERIEKSKLFQPLAESKSTKVYLNQEWFTLGHSLLTTKAEIAKLEKEAFLTLRDEVLVEDSAIRENAAVFAELDVMCGFATLASEMNYVRPQINDGLGLTIQNGRHPTVEQGLLKLSRMFTPNSLAMSDSSRLHMITGPNMGGKSTFLRQTALIAILAQAGSFVPADYAEIGLIDKIFTRIGAKDDLFRDRSTFMVEMLETAEILRNATEKSLVIMDEVGRGTTVKDGLSIAFATVHHLYHMNRCRALFATHFHEIIDMLGFSETTSTSAIFPGIKFSCTEIEEDECGRFTYSHRMRSGVNRDSHGLKVAQLAGMPPSALKVAQEVLAYMKEPESDDDKVGTRSMTGMLLELGKRFAVSDSIQNPK